ncbi:MAG TPA: c-type cytochrome biogenesis protein CcsB [Streptosporangiaceae bacterium]
MHLNIGLADFSQGMLLSAIVIYALAMLGYAGDFAFGRRPAATAAAGASAAAPAAAELIGASVAGARPAAGPAPGGPPPAAQPAANAIRGGTGAWVRVAFTLTCVGLFAHVTGIVSRGIAEHRVPWGNMYEFIMAISCMAVLVLVVVAGRYRAHYIGLFVLIPVVFALGLAVTVVYTPAGALVPALQSYWIAIHVTAMIIASGLYIVGAVVTVMYLVADRSLRRTAAGLPSATSGIVARLPKPDVLDRLSYRTILGAFPVWTFGVMAGAIWADQAWGRYWGWDPKETWSFITWVVYAGFLHARATAGWRGRRAAYIQLVGFGCLMFNLIGINLWVSGLHSYAGLN